MGWFFLGCLFFLLLSFLSLCLPLSFFLGWCAQNMTETRMDGEWHATEPAKLPYLLVDLHTTATTLTSTGTTSSYSIIHTMVASPTIVFWVSWLAEPRWKDTIALKLCSIKKYNIRKVKWHVNHVDWHLNWILEHNFAQLANILSLRAKRQRWKD